MALSTIRSVISDSVVRVSTCTLNQWAMDFEGNRMRILAAVNKAKADGAKLVITPELSVAGYGCEDHFLEADTLLHSILSLAELLRNGPADIAFAVGMPWLFRGVRYNANVICLNGRILLVRPKMAMANDGNYRELRYFAPWDASRGVLEAELPKELRFAAQTAAPFGHAVLSFDGVTVGVETCEELFANSPAHAQLALNGCELFLNSSGSHHELRKSDRRAELIRGAMRRCGGVYLYANQRGCDGGRVYFDGSAAINVNGDFVGQAAQFGVCDVETVVASVDVGRVRSKRAAVSSSSAQASKAGLVPVIEVGFSLAAAAEHQRPAPKKAVSRRTAEQEIALGPACWLWDHLRRSGGGGFFVALSGGADSAATASMAGIMCQLVFAEVRKGGAEILAELRRVVRSPGFAPTSHRQIADRVLHTCYMGSANSSDAPRALAAALSRQLGAFHKEAPIDAMVMAGLHVYGSFVSGGAMPRFAAAGGAAAEDLALQNLQARSRMVLAYLMAQLLPGQRRAAEGVGGGFLLVLGSANVDESLLGYLTKYDCSSADLNPIGGIGKADLKSFLLYAADVFGYPALKSIARAPPTAELRPMAGREPLFGASASWACAKTLAVLDSPLRPAPPPADSLSIAAGGEAHSQLDEADMGMSYAELSVFGRLRQIERCGPFEMYKALLNAGGVWATLTPAQIAAKVKGFFHFYGANRHKMTTLTPSYHAERYGPDDNRFDHRQFLYPPWEGCVLIDAHVKSCSKRAVGASGE